MSRPGQSNARDEAEFKQLDTVIAVETPEQISFQYQSVGPFRRLLAYGLDLLIVTLAFVGLCFVFYCAIALLEYLFSGIGLSGFIGELAISSIGLLLAVAAFMFWFYGAICETVRNGQTFGKSIAQIRVLSVDGSAIDGVQAMIRNLFRFLDVMPLMPTTLFFVFDVSSYFDTSFRFPLFLIGLLCMVLTPKFQRVGDLVAGTMVVSVERDWVPQLVTFEDPRVAQLAELIPNDFLVSPSLAKALASFVESMPRLGPEHAEEIAVRLGRPLIEKFNFAPDVNSTLLLCALYFKTFAQFSVDENNGNASGADISDRLSKSATDEAQSPVVAESVPSV